MTKDFTQMGKLLKTDLILRKIKTVKDTWYVYDQKDGLMEILKETG